MLYILYSIPVLKAANWFQTGVQNCVMAAFELKLIKARHLTRGVARIVKDLGTETIRIKPMRCGEQWVWSHCLS